MLKARLVFRLEKMERERGGGICGLQGIPFKRKWAVCDPMTGIPGVLTDVSVENRRSASMDTTPWYGSPWSFCGITVYSGNLSLTPNRNFDIDTKYIKRLS